MLVFLIRKYSDSSTINVKKIAVKKKILAGNAFTSSSIINQTPTTNCMVIYQVETFVSDTIPVKKGIQEFRDRTLSLSVAVVVAAAIVAVQAIVVAEAAAAADAAAVSVVVLAAAAAVIIVVSAITYYSILYWL